MSAPSSAMVRRLAWPAAAGSVALTITALVLSRIEGGAFGDDLGLWSVSMLGVASLAAMGALIASRTGNLVGWILLGIVASFALSFLGAAYGEAAVPRSAALGGFALTVIASVPLFLALALFPSVFLLFPTGRLPSRRWRPVGAVYVAGLIVLVVGFSLKPLRGHARGVWVTNPLGIESIDGILDVILGITGFLLLACAFASLAASIVRYRGGGTEERQQIRWLAYVGAIAAGALIGTIVTGTIVESDPVRWDGSPLDTVNGALFVTTAAALGLGIPIACMVAILRYRLYELDRVVRRTVLVAILGLAITAVYVAAVGLAGTVVRGDAARLLAAAAVAVVFQPVRDRARKLADRLVYGERATPYEVLASFTDRVGGSYAADDVLPRMVHVLASAIGAERASVWIRVGDALRLEALWPSGPVPGERPLEKGGLPGFGDDHAVEVRDRGELLGAIVVRMPPGDPMTPTKERLVHDLASQAGLVLRNVRLIEELRASRQRLVTAQNEERRRIERNIHDGAQQQLVALNVQLGLLARAAESDPETVSTMAVALQELATTTLEELRDLARGIYPPLLADRGLVAALEAQARRSPIPVEVAADGLGRYPREVEAAAYFCVLEALQNVAKYADASRAIVRMSAGEGELRFEVEDDGAGFDPHRTGQGTGLQGMADRVDAIGGRLDVRSAPGEGTTIVGRLPIRGAR
jgi:signal transduction histidine kinase